MFQLSPHLWAPQRHGIEQAIGLLQQGHDLCLYGPTGSGKTVQAMELTRWGLSQGNGVCFYVNRKLLVGQSVNRFQQAGIQVGVRAAEYEDMFDPDAPVQICSADTERARVMKDGNSHGWDFHDAGLVIVDEAHIQKAKTMQKIVDAHRQNGARIVLLTATPIGLSHMVNQLVISGTMKEYRDCKALVPAVVKTIEQPDMRHVRRDAVGEYILDGKKKKLYVQSIIANVIDSWKTYNPDARPAMAYWPGKPESIWGTKQFTDIGVPFAHVDATDAVIPERKIIDGQKCLVTRRVKLTRRIWDEILQRFTDGDIVGISSRFKCLDSKTEILTRRGWVGIDDISDQDEAAGFIESTGEIRFNGVRGVVKRALACGEGMYGLSRSNLEMRVTGTHSMIYKSSGGCKNWKRMDASELASKDGSYTVPVAGEYAATGVPLTDSQISVIGWFLTDGHMRSCDFNICQSVNQPEYLHDHITSSLEGAGLSVVTAHYGKNNGYGGFIRYSVKKSCNPGYNGLLPYLDKKVSRLLSDVTRDQLLVLLHAMRNGDGCKRKNPTWVERTHEIFTGDADVADRIQALCVTRGIRCTISPRASGYNIYYSPARPWATVRGRDEKDGVKRATFRRLENEDSERVWCVETEEGTIVTRRNGKVAIMGNCREGIDVPFAYHLILATPIGSICSAVQTVGRVLRYSPQTPDHVIITDHGGLYWTHGSPNHDKPWREWWGKKEAHIVQEQQRGRSEHGEPEPMRCMFCKSEFVRVVYIDGSPCCPLCKEPFTKSRRSVRQLDGRLVDVDGPLSKPVRTKMTPTVAKDWERMFWSYWRNGKKRTFAQMEAWFTKQNGFHPPRTIPFMPRDKEVWNMFVHTVPLDRLTLPEDWRGHA